MNHTAFTALAAALLLGGCAIQQPIQPAQAPSDSLLLNASRIVDVRAQAEVGTSEEGTPEEFCELLGEFAETTAILRDAGVPEETLLSKIEHNPPASDFLRYTVITAYSPPRASPDTERRAAKVACLIALQ